MKIALIGYGKMGQQVEKVARERGHLIVAKISSTSQDFQSLSKADICIDFSHPKKVLDHMKQIVFFEKDLVLGTTGWESDISEVETLLERHKGGFLYSANFSLGFHLFKKNIQAACRIMSSFPEYDLGGIEYHHRNKVDAPSGTARALSELIKEEMRMDEVPSFSSVRIGSNPGMHQVFFDSSYDTIELTHRVRNRKSFAVGAVEASEWLLGKKGRYSLDDFIQARFSC